MMASRSDLCAGSVACAGVYVCADPGIAPATAANPAVTANLDARAGKEITPIPVSLSKAGLRTFLVPAFHNAIAGVEF
jgi:hypothetical protein